MQINMTGSGVMTFPSSREPVGKEASGSRSFAAALAGANVKAAAGAPSVGTADGAATTAPSPAGAAATAAAPASGTANANANANANAGAANNSSSTSATDSAQATDTANGTEDRFLKLLVAQLRNQDPLNPMDNAAVTTQLAQINTVRGIEDLNTKMGEFLKAGQQGSVVSSVGLMGRQVVVPGDGFDYDPSKLKSADGSPQAGARFGFDVGSDASAVEVQLLDSSGKVLASQALKDVPAGPVTFAWDGKDSSGSAVPAGRLTVKVMAAQGNTPLEARGLVPATVVGVAQGPASAGGSSTGTTMIELEGGGTVPASDVKMIQ